MTAATTPLGLALFGLVMAVFIAQEFTRGFGTPDDGDVRDDRAALLYLEALPVVLVTAAFGLSVAGWMAWPASWPVLGIGLALGTVPAFTVAFVGTLPAMIRRIQVEERVLHGALGERYTAYAEARSRLVPGLW